MAAARPHVTPRWRSLTAGMSGFPGTVKFGEVAAISPPGKPGSPADQMSVTNATSNDARLSTVDLVPDEPLRGTSKRPIADGEDLLRHRVIARKVAELATSSNGKVNIALFGPWGSGKSSFNGLLAEELAAIDPNAHHITFDAWKNAGQGFRTNFLSELAQQIPKADRNISDQLFQATTRVTFPLVGKFSGKKWVIAAAVIGILTGLFVVLPLLWTILQNAVHPVADFGAALRANMAAWAGFAAGSTLLLVVIAGLIELSKVTVTKSAPSHVAQFGALFDKLLNTDKKGRYVVFIDELDRCGEEDVMTTLEGLRTFLGHDRCVFVVAFDRDAIATTIAKRMNHNVPTQPSSPYYRTSGEYLDKIFQFQMSLPPQPPHTFRRYALSLVVERGGVWEAVRTHRAGLLDRVVTVLSPMHLASPRRTKVLLNDFAVNARVYESLGFDWLDRAEEIAVLTVLQTEFPNLMADIERAPSLMRFLYRREGPQRPELVDLLSRYQTPDERPDLGVADAEKTDEIHLDRIVGDGDEDFVARELQANLSRYLRRLREMDVPEPKADLVMMHSDGALLHFEDPGVYHEVLLAADTPRKDFLEAMAPASPGDRSLAIDHLLEQAERESADIALSLRVISGELAAELPHMSAKQAAALRSGVARGLDGYTVKSLEGYASAVAASYTKSAATKILVASAEKSDEALGAVAGRFSDELASSDWNATRHLIGARVFRRADSVPSTTARVLRRMAQDADFELDDKLIKQFAASLSITKPEEIAPAAATTAARQEAEEQNTLALANFEQQRAAKRASASTIAEVWTQLPEESPVAHGFLKVLRLVSDETGWYLDLHDQLIRQEINEERFAAANSYLLDAITDKPKQAGNRWRNLLSDTAPVRSDKKASALGAVVNRATSIANVHSQMSSADTAYRIAELPSERVPARDLLAQIADDIDLEWQEYTDSRFEYQLRLLAAIDLLDDPAADTTAHRVQLFVDAVASAQQEDASVNQIVASVKSASPSDAAAIAAALHEAQLWEDDYPQRSLEVLLAAQERALAAGEAIQPIPATAISQLADTAVRKPIADAWLATAPSLDDVGLLLGAVSFAAPSWRTYGERVTDDQRAATWRKLTQIDAPITAIRALSMAGQSHDVYEAAAATVRDASSKDVRERAMDRFLALPVTPGAAGLALALVKSIAADKKRTELPLTILLIRAYSPHWSKQIVAGLQSTLTPWVEAGEIYVPKRDQTWLVDMGFIARRSSLFEQWFSAKRK